VATGVDDFPEQIPLGAGVIIENNDGIVSALCTALEQIRMHQAKFAGAMVAARHHAQWPDIADRIIAFLKTN